MTVWIVYRRVCKSWGSGIARRECPDYVKVKPSSYVWHGCCFKRVNFRYWPAIWK